MWLLNRIFKRKEKEEVEVEETLEEPTSELVEDVLNLGYQRRPYRFG